MLFRSREVKLPSQFLKELPSELMTSNVRVVKGTSQLPKKISQEQRETNSVSDWSVGDRVIHDIFGEGEITHVLDSGKKVTVVVQFPGMGRKILDPTAKLSRI